MNKQIASGLEELRDMRSRMEDKGRNLLRLMVDDAFAKNKKLDVFIMGMGGWFFVDSDGNDPTDEF